jgi:hypothetical protein
MQNGLLSLSCLSLCLCVRLFVWNNSILTSRILMKLDIRGVFENMSRKFKYNPLALEMDI